MCGAEILPLLRAHLAPIRACLGLILDVRSLPYQAAYAASKHAIVALADALRVELAREGVPISVTTILPATINTPFYAKARTKLGVKPRGAPPMYEPAVVADAILRAARKPARHRFVGGAGRILALGQALSPDLWTCC